MCWNGPKSWQSGWYSERHATFEYIQGVAVDYTLIGQVDIPNSSSGDVIIKVNQQTSTDFYVAFNRKVGSNSGTVEGGNQVMVWRAGGEGSGYAESELLAKLNAGNTYTITDFDGTGNDLDVVVNSIDLSASPVAVASITIGTGTAQPSKSPTPVPSASPTVSAAPSKAPTPFPTKAVSDLKVCLHDISFSHLSLMIIFYSLAHATPYSISNSISSTLYFGQDRPKLYYRR